MTNHVEEPDLYRIEWKAKYRDHSGHGDWSDDKSLLESFAIYGNDRYPDIDHVVIKKCP